MKITHCISSIDESTGGPARSVTFLIDELGRLNDFSSINLLTVESKNPLIHASAHSKVNLLFYPKGILMYSMKLIKKLNVLDTRVFHVHGIWEFFIHQTIKIARKRNIPYIISIRGMLEPWSLTQSTFKKKLALFLFQHKDLKQATCLHATGQMEVESIRNLGYTNPIANIPNGINLVEFPLKDFSVIKSKKTVLFLSRIHPKKGIEILIESWSLIDTQLRDNWSIEIAGNGDAKYIKSLNNLIAFKGLDHEIKIVGSKFGADKINTYHNADLFVLPTYSENFGIVVAEALACGIPVITTQGTPWQDLERNDAGRWINLDTQHLKYALEDLMSKSDQQREQMGKNGRKLIEDNYSIEAVANKMVQLYSWILKRSNKPDFVLL